MNAGDGLARLPRDARSKRRRQIGLHLNEAEYAALSEVARLAGLKPGAWLTKIGLERAAALTVPADAEYRVWWSDGQVTYHAPGAVDAMISALDGQLDDLEPEESITITRIRKG